jgi:Na+/H+-translocating membrane pyrophosphatase
LGIYQWYWWYKINEEVREYDERIRVQPGLAVAALLVPIVNFVTAFVTLFTTGGRIAQTQRFAGSPARCSGLFGLVFAFLLGTHTVYYQSQLNRIWELHGNQAPGTSV